MNQASVPEKIAKCFVYSILSVAFLFGLLTAFTLVSRPRHDSGGEVTKKVGGAVFDYIDSPIFIVLAVICILLSWYSALKGVPLWLQWAMKVLAAIAIWPVTLRAALEGRWVFSTEQNEAELKPDISARERVTNAHNKSKQQGPSAGTH